MPIQQVLMMKSNQSFALTARTVSGNNVVENPNPAPPPAILRTAGWAKVTFRNDGTLLVETRSDNGTATGVATDTSNVITGEWMVGALSSDYEIQVVVTGTAVNGTSATNGSGVWNNLGTNRVYERTSTVATVTSSACAVTIRNTSTLATVCSATITLNMN